MQKSTCLAIAGMILTAAIGACGNSSATTTGTQATGDTGTGGTVATSSSTAGPLDGSGTTVGTGGSTASSTAASTAASTGSGSTKVDGCDPAAAVDMTGMTAVTIKFGGAVGTAYDKPCIKVTKGTMVTFSGDFTSHPLVGGDAPPASDATSPIASTSTGTTATFTLGNAGTFGYFCSIHYSFGMEGAIVVQ